MDRQKNKLQKKTAFTLIELIIVITILTILWTIAFMGFKSYAGNARDGNRLATLSQIKSWLEIYNLKTWEYPFPEENIFTWVVQWQILAYKGEISNDISRKINISKTPKDPESITQNYIYGVTNNKQQYQIWALLENDISYLKNPIIENVYANTSQLRASVKWNYKWYITFSSWGTVYIANIPSLLFNFSWSINSNGINLTDENVYYITNKWENIPYSLWKNIQINNTNTQKVIQNITWNQNSDLVIISTDEIYNYINNNILPEYLNEDTLLSSFWIQDKKNFEYILKWEPLAYTNNWDDTNIENPNTSTGNILLSFSEVEQWWTVTISNNCTTSPTWYISSNDNIARIMWQEIKTYSAWNVTIFPVWWACENNNWVSLTVVPSQLWQQEDSNCQLDDFVFTYDGVKYVWAWCNSTLWTWLTFQNDNDNSCRNYEWWQKNQIWCDTLAPLDYYNSLGVWWNSEIDTIWWKLYTWNQANTNACQNGWHLSTEEEWEILETYLKDGVNCRNNTNSWQCSWLWWNGNQTKKTYNNIVKALNLPLSGNRDWYPDGEWKLYYHTRWERTLLWTSRVENQYDSYYRYFHYNVNQVSRWVTYNEFWFSARCVKDR